MDDIADSDFDMSAAQEDISNSLFPKEEPVDPIEETVDEHVDEPEAPIEKPIETRPPPQSWKKEMHDHWKELKPEVQEYFELRENQMREGVEIAKGDVELGRSIRDIITPYQDLLKSQGVKDTDAVKYLLNAHYNLSNADENGRVQLIHQLAQSYGINLDGTKVAPEIQTLQQKINQLEQEVNLSKQYSQQEKQAKLQTELDDFASKHEFFDDVADEMIPFINAGYTLQESYDKAIWANESTRLKEIERIEKEKVQKIEEEKQSRLAEKQKAKSTNVRHKDTSASPTGKSGKKMFEDLDDIYQNIQSRS